MPGETELVKDLLRPEAYPEPRPRQVELVSTHISWVFLTGEGVWKVKRPVNLGFVDFSTVDRRHHFCEEEIRLNRRLAPNVYLGIVPVRLAADGYSFVGNGEVVDHAVRMRRLPECRSARALLLRDELSPQLLARLADRLARFYAEAREIQDLEGLGASMAANIEENLSQLQPFAARCLDLARFQAVAAAQQQDLLRFGARLRERQGEGRMREGHGDLRLEHVYFPESPEPTSAEPASTEPLVIDAVEFSERFRSGDVALDVAFFAMELEAAGRPDLAEYFLYRCARETNDYDCYPLLDFYVCYRALVRAKVACFLAVDCATPAPKARRKEEEAVQLLGLAFSRTRPRFERPVVISVGGQVGTGKSTFAEALARRLALPVISSDRVRKFLGGVSPMEKGPGALYTAEHSRRTYGEVIRRAESVLDSGRGVILDATFSSRDWRHRARDLAAAHDALFVFIEATCDENTVRTRLQVRSARPSESDADVAVWAGLRAVHEPPDELRPEERITIDTCRQEHDLVAEVKARIASRTAAL